MENKTFTLDWDFFLKVALFAIILYFLFLVQSLVIWCIFALVLSILFNFIIDFLEKKKLPRTLATAAVYIGLLAIIGFFIYKMAPVFLGEIKQFTSNIPYYLQKVSPFIERLGITVFEKANFLSLLENNLEQAGQNVLNALIAIFGGVQATMFIVFLAFFFSLEKSLLERILSNFSPKRYKDYLFNLLPRVKKQVSGWFLSRVIGVIFVGILTFIALTILNVKYAFILSLIAGLLDFLPVIGPVIAGVAITLIVMISSFSQSVFVLISFFIIQQLENNLLFPILFKKFIGLPPALVLIAVVIGAQLWGLLGAILAIPLTGVIFEVIKDYLKIKRKA